MEWFLNSLFLSSVFNDRFWFSIGKNIHFLFFHFDLILDLSTMFRLDVFYLGFNDKLFSYFFGLCFLVVLFDLPVDPNGKLFWTHSFFNIVIKHISYNPSNPFWIDVFNFINSGTYYWIQQFICLSIVALSWWF